MHMLLTCIDIDAKVYAIPTLGCMLLPELIQHISGIKPGVITQLAGNDLQRLGVGIDEQLRLAGNCASVIPQISAPDNQSINAACRS